MENDTFTFSETAALMTAEIDKPFRYADCAIADINDIFYSPNPIPALTSL